MYTLQLDKPDWIKSEEPCWEEGFQNFANLLPYRAGEATDATFDIDLPSQSTNTNTFAQVSIGRYFDRPAWNEEGVTLTTLHQQVFPVAKSASDLSICVRVIQLKED